MKKKRNILLFFILLTSGLFFFLINETTAEPGMTEGNGNPGLLFMVLTVPLYIYFYILLHKFFLELFSTNNRNTVQVYILIAFFVLLGIVVGEYYYIIHRLEELGNPYYPNSNVSRITFAGPFINNWFFNIYTFLLAPILSILVTGMQHLFRIKNRV